MGKAAKWFRGLLSFKKADSASPPPSKQQKENRRWSFVRSYREKGDLCAKRDPNKLAIAAAEAVVVRVTSSRRSGNVTSKAYGFREQWIASVKIQSAFRGYLARKALRALRGLVRLQAMVRGHIERKRTTEWLQRMQALLRAQARARAGRSQISYSSRSSTKSSQAHYLGPATPEKSEELIRAKSRKHDQLLTLKKNGSNLQDRALLERNRSDRYANQQSQDLQGSYTTADTADDQKSDKILEIDRGQRHLTTKSRNHFHPSQHVDQDIHSYTASKDSTAQFPSLSSGEVQSLCPLKLSKEVEDGLFYTADDSPQFFSASSRGGSSRRSPLTPSKSDGSRSYLSGYSDHPNYMSYTESSKAKARSLSAPKQRPHFDRSSSSKRNSIHGYGESRPGSQKVSGLHANFRNKAYPGSGRLDQLGMSVGFRC